MALMSGGIGGWTVMVFMICNDSFSQMFLLWL
jgi:hypothetical protein